MNYNEIGKTGMKVSQLSFGASSLGGVFHSVKEADALEAVFTAVELGMNFIDVSQLKDFSYVFYNYANWNGDISEWDTMSAETMDCMFMMSQFTGEHGGIEGWDVRSVKTASRMFYKAKFEGDISSWDLRDLDVKRSQQMLAGAIAKSRKKWPKKFR